ncbi:hypothetical protein [Desulfuromonas thiophila]|uniref:Lipoprotein n=1 Tax=Desulfuromonas thiophila TaxID=57664 RepID=A0A1G6ZP29_9BACT|nr:hypothetical protein [Desulfuromonas thiophila]SDE04252.1 hypothetical protein SAMN05661003_10361 [Desulfuromonas thiophila]
MLKPTRLLLVALLALPLTGLGGCGKRGPLKPLRQPLPQAVGQAALSQKGDALLLGWDAPRANQDGSPLSDLKGFAVYKIDYEPAKGCPECRIPQQLWRQVDLAGPANDQSQRYYLWDNAVDEDTGYRYRIVPLTRAGGSGAETLLHRPLLPAPPAPPAPAARALAHQVELRWSAAELQDAARQSGGSWLGVNLYRCDAGAYYGPRPLNSSPITADLYRDSRVQNGQCYQYALRSVVQYGEQIVESRLGTAIEACPQLPQGL